MGIAVAALVTAVVAPLALAATPAAASECKAIPGWDHVLTRTAAHWIVIGELHGTAEMPAVFADAVCLTAERRGPVVVALEIPSGDQAAIDAFMASDGEQPAQHEFFKALIWHMPKDGRSSEAFFRLFDRLRQMHREGQVAHVVAFQDSSPAQDPLGDQGPYEKRLAAIVRDAGAGGETVLVLVGGTHARKTEFAPGVDGRKPFMPLASLLPPERTVTFNMLGNGGAAWYCGGPKPADCAAHEVRSTGEPRQRGVDLHAVENGTYDGLLRLGTKTTASPPQPIP